SDDRLTATFIDPNIGIIGRVCTDPLPLSDGLGDTGADLGPEPLMWGPVMGTVPDNGSGHTLSGQQVTVKVPLHSWVHLNWWLVGDDGRSLYEMSNYTNTMTQGSKTYYVHSISQPVDDPMVLPGNTGLTSTGSAYARGTALATTVNCGDPSGVNGP